ncbi:MAG: hypothetical protein KDC44_23710 [Phaeodactylibacter sp.]|nr:hypothetical protein [Phaeodactylibacter sp.]
MPTTKIQVYKNGKLATNVKVVLEFTGLTNMGFTKAHYTNAQGVAFVEHSSTGIANVYLNGSKNGSLRTPGQEIYYL